MNVNSKPSMSKANIDVRSPLWPSARRRGRGSRLALESRRSKALKGSGFPKHRPVPQTGSQAEGILFLPFPTVVIVEPTAYFKICLASERVAFGVGENGYPPKVGVAVFLLEDAKGTFVDVPVTGGTDTNNLGR